MRESERKSESDFGPLLIFCKAAFNLPAAQRFTAGLQSGLPFSPQLPQCHADCQVDCLPSQTSLRAAISAHQRARPDGTQRPQHLPETARKITAFELRVSILHRPAGAIHPIRSCRPDRLTRRALRFMPSVWEVPGELRRGPVRLAATRTRGRLRPQNTGVQHLCAVSARRPQRAPLWGGGARLCAGRFLCSRSGLM